MSGRRDSLTPPERSGTKDPGAHELDSSESDDHFSDAQSVPRSPSASPIPKLRVEKVSHEPSYGEVPGTEAYKMREEDAEPDEIAVVPEEKKSSDGEDEAGDIKSPATPGGHPIPKTVVEESSGNSVAQSHPEVKHKGDASPDVLIKSPVEQEGTVEPISPALSSPQSVRSRRKSSIAKKEVEGADDGDDEFGDDFDDFEEGDEEAEFDDFDDGFQEPVTPAAPVPSSAPAIQPLSFSIPDFDGLDPDDIVRTTEPYLDALFPTTAGDDMPPTPTVSSKDNPIFLTQRSASLWSQLVAPPPLQPPDWIRSRIRRLFLVSLGVPVDLDEILPASKQKKLVLPSMNSPRTSTDSRRSGSRAPSRLKSPQPGQESVPDGPVSSKPRGPPPPPEFDLVAARQLCTTTDEALDGMTDGELKEHIGRLEGLEGTAMAVLEYWKDRTDEQIKEREAFEGVIENLVKHARKTRK
ncbi:hypothetical protein M406DRAFT_273487 [Cryphonectria parasitica EP155]|uniref:Uncharacterized protein n=1 Tax=Cryphonectria parasitica (strain ATCC 38755 / EP155) TaxID=660469 RepID=A0A9P5CS54_CRYP1|nr:uncharacterized protein M406DRAFT_273487 [Cryphonectria parasitica EP155]KAF3768948.1 hypothetical protein M406DRAFT_273487 [Cryphonectria parasitica EP155]